MTTRSGYTLNLLSYGWLFACTFSVEGTKEYDIQLIEKMKMDIMIIMMVNDGLGGDDACGCSDDGGDGDDDEMLMNNDHDEE